MILAIAYAAMFKIVPNPTFAAPVYLSRPDADEPVRITVTWRHQDARALDKWLAALATSAEPAEHLHQVIESWAQVVDAEGAPVPYTRTALESILIQFPSSGAEFVRAYVGRIKDARAKN